MFLNMFTAHDSINFYTSLFHRLGRKKTRNMQTNKQQKIEKKTQKQYLSNSDQVNAVHATQP